MKEKNKSVLIFGIYIIFCAICLRIFIPIMLSDVKSSMMPPETLNPIISVPNPNNESFHFDHMVAGNVIALHYNKNMIILPILGELPDTIAKFERQRVLSQWRGNLLKAIADTEEDLLPQGDLYRNIEMDYINTANTIAVFNLNLTKPKLDVQRLKLLKGTIDYFVPADTKKIDTGIVDFEKGHIGTELQISIKKIQQHWRDPGKDLELEFKIPEDQIKAITFLDENGSKLEVRKDSYNTSIYDCGITFFRFGGFPAKGRIIVEIYTYQHYPVNFKIKDIALVENPERDTAYMHDMAFVREEHKKYVGQQPSQMDVTGTYTLIDQTIIGGGSSVFGEKVCQIQLRGDATFTITNYPDWGIAEAMNKLVDETFINTSGLWKLQEVMTSHGYTSEEKRVWGVVFSDSDYDINSAAIMGPNPPFTLKMVFGDPDSKNVLYFKKLSIH